MKWRTALGVLWIIFSLPLILFAFAGFFIGVGMFCDSGDCGAKAFSFRVLLVGVAILICGVVSVQRRTTPLSLISTVLLFLPIIPFAYFAGSFFWGYAIL